LRDLLVTNFLSIMPIYAYRCVACGLQKDVLQKLSEPALTRCPTCEAESFVKQLSAPAFQLKGSGWYVTDFRDNGKKADGKPDGRNGADGPAANGSEGGDQGGTADKAKPAEAGTAASSEGAAPSPSSPAPAASKAAGSTAGASAETA
jgi:putative FmdB family regulatory protein